jgi:hypothetical protein
MSLRDEELNRALSKIFNRAPFYFGIEHRAWSIEKYSWQRTACSRQEQAGTRD